MSAFQLFLCIVLSNLVFLSLPVTAVTTNIFCAKTICMVINQRVCCGVRASGPSSADDYVVVEWDPSPAQMEVSITVAAGFPETDTDDETSSPTCSETFTWPATVNDRVLNLHFTDQLALAYNVDNEIIPQKFFKINEDDILQDTGTDTCPTRAGLLPTINPYNKNRVKPFIKSPSMLNKQPIDYAESSGPVTPVANDGVDAITGAGNSDSVATPPIPDFGTPVANFMPTVLASTFDTSLNTIGSNGGECTGFDCDVDVASFDQSYPNILKRGTPVEFRA